MLWKNSPDVKGRKLKFGKRLIYFIYVHGMIYSKFVSVGDNAAMWKMWLELTKDVRKGWLVAGNLLFDMNLIHKSKEREVWTV
jgi:hypothetical protein